MTNYRYNSFSLRSDFSYHFFEDLDQDEVFDAADQGLNGVDSGLKIYDILRNCGSLTVDLLGKGLTTTDLGMKLADDAT